MSIRTASYGWAPRPGEGGPGRAADLVTAPGATGLEVGGAAAFRVWAAGRIFGRPWGAVW